MDGDPHLYILYASNLGRGVLGYFFANNEYLPAIREHSNAHEMFLLSTSRNLDDTSTYSTLAHEFQHMIHWKQDRNEASWLNEGAAELAVFLNEYYVGGADWSYASNPDLQLTDWVDSSSPDFGTQYGSAFLFMTYFLDRFGEEATKTLIHHAANGMDSVDQTLTDIDARDAFTGEPLTADDVFLDWVIANYLQDGSVDDGETPTTGSATFCPRNQGSADLLRRRQALHFSP